jgi:hypothetical protein
MVCKSVTFKIKNFYKPCIEAESAIKAGVIGVQQRLTESW